MDAHNFALAPETILPCQLADRSAGTAQLQAEKRLQLAVLEDAVRTFHRLAGAERHRPGRLFAEVDDWFASDETDGPFTFVTICDTLGIDPDYIRGGLRRWRARSAGTPQTRPLFRRATLGTRHRVVSRPLRRSA
jgi:hypothetical protein